MSLIFLFSAFVIATCGLIYELVAGTLASYLLGDSVTQFSTVIGVYLFSMGIGSYFTRFVQKRYVYSFVMTEILIGLVGGCSSAALFLLFDKVASFRFCLFTLLAVTGCLVGFELPLLMRILKDELEFKDLVAKVFTFDYVGALLASLLFPLVLIPHLGLIRTSFFFGILNVMVAIWTLVLLEKKNHTLRRLYFAAGSALIVLILGFIGADQIMSFSETSIYPGQVIFSKSTSYQRIVISRFDNDIRLFLNAHLQFSSRDEYRYHEALIHPGLDAITSPKRVLVLGGGDGMAVREILKHPGVESIELIDLDPEMTQLFSSQNFLTELNGNALLSPKVHVTNADAFIWLREHPKNKYDFVVLDFPDPANYSIGKLFTTTFFKLLHGALSADGAFVVQSTSPLAARQSYWCIAHTLEAAGFQITPYHAYVPSFGEWGFVIATHRTYRPPEHFVDHLKFLTAGIMPTLLHFPLDMAELPTDINKLNNQALVRYYEKEWTEYVVY
jgi:spermidine synthase